MASLTIRNIPDDVQRRFRAQASAKGMSMEAEARRLVIAAVTETVPPQRKSIGQMIYEMSRPGIDLPIPPRSPARVPDLE
ncbi:hypothetical protein KZX46_15870 [Polymorphobacter sp. PAMC 29334]|uniref:FitA-like ribbon-helix-helix domain-containing protein n=1 Tax=Polymorphobacter sp. PAMC 29334 TaxID=2862331 RepID=UPI001C787DD1|nr:hypothetical protein [Polymorphobacter sp. PAMC 29334]QYE34245.1 hypothetical protein KZX46_15870 [Polymorphobacter sp. PAMC 29334]